MRVTAGIYLLKVNNKNTRTRCETCSKLTIKILEPCHWCRSSFFIVNFEHVIVGWVRSHFCFHGVYKCDIELNYVNFSDAEK